MNRQEVFDKVAAHLLTQREKSKDSYGCLYRSPDGLKCAIGCLIPDNLYDKAIENSPVDELPENILRFIGVEDSIEDINFLTDLQIIHDDSLSENWREKLINFAEDKGLVWKHG